MTVNLPFDDPLVWNLFHHVEASGLPLIFHLAPQVGGYYGMVDELHLPRLERTLQRFPKLPFLGHSQPFWAEISADVTDENRNGYPHWPGRSRRARARADAQIPQPARRPLGGQRL